MKKYRIGCSGYYYPQWKNKLYPKGLAPRNWLTHYSSVFNTVELNGTFYRTPKPADLKKYHSVTPEDFTFSVKMNKSITHIQRLSNKQVITDFQNLVLEGLQDKLQHFLFQMPPSFQYTEENLQKVLEHIAHSSQNVIEFRHISWWNDHVKRMLANATITFCNVDYPGLDTHLVQTTEKFYLRLHGNPHVFVTPYTTQKLEYFYSLLPPDVKTYTVYFNNTVTEAGFQNALQFMDIINSSVHESA